jgi:hypothetical protein
MYRFPCNSMHWQPHWLPQRDTTCLVNGRGSKPGAWGAPATAHARLPLCVLSGTRRMQPRAARHASRSAPIAVPGAGGRGLWASDFWRPALCRERWGKGQPRNRPAARAGLGFAPGAACEAVRASGRVKSYNLPPIMIGLAGVGLQHWLRLDCGRRWLEAAWRRVPNGACGLRVERGPRAGQTSALGRRLHSVGFGPPTACGRNAAAAGASMHKALPATAGAGAGWLGVGED